MKIVQFEKFIREFPYKNQSFDIKKINWKIDSQEKLIESIFKKNKIITINRYELENSVENLREFAVKTLMWGYPTKGRGKNIEKILEKKSFEKLITVLEHYKEKDISIEQLKIDLKSINGLGLSTLSKFMNFLNTSIDGNKAVILDLQIIASINDCRFEDFTPLKGITYENAIRKYSEYLGIINNISNQIKAHPDQIEIFLFSFGRKLSKIN